MTPDDSISATVARLARTQGRWAIVSDSIDKLGRLPQFFTIPRGADERERAHIDSLNVQWRREYEVGRVRIPQLTQEADSLVALSNADRALLERQRATKGASEHLAMQRARYCRPGAAVTPARHP